MHIDHLRVVLDRSGFIIEIEDHANLLGYGKEVSKLINQNWFNCCLDVSDVNTVKNVFFDIIKSHGTTFESYRNDVLMKDGHHTLLDFKNRIIEIEGEEHIESFGFEYHTKSIRLFSFPEE